MLKMALLALRHEYWFRIYCVRQLACLLQIYVSFDAGSGFSESAELVRVHECTDGFRL